MTMKLAAATAALLLAFAAPALADGPRTVRVAEHYEIRVSASAAENPEAGAQLVDAMRVAAKRLCRDVGPRVKRDRCEAAALANAARSVTPELRVAIERALLSEPKTLFADNR